MKNVARLVDLYNPEERSELMTNSPASEDYFRPFKEAIQSADVETEPLLLYFNTQRQRMIDLIDAIDPETFWQILPEILGIDAKLMLLIELIGFEDFPTQEILRIVEEDYLFYFKELCGYDLSMETKPSMLFKLI